MSTNQSGSVILTDSASWSRWIDTIKRLAVPAGIWRYIDPDALIPLSPPLEPIQPTLASLFPGVERFSALNTDQQKDLNYAREEYKYDLDRFKRQEAAFADIRKFILSSIDV